MQNKPSHRGFASSSSSSSIHSLSHLPMMVSSDPNAIHSHHHHHHHHSSKNGVNKEVTALQHQLRQSQALYRSSRKRIENLTKMAVRIHRGLIRQMEVQHGTYPTRIPSVPSSPSKPGSVTSIQFAQMLYSQLPVRMKAKDAVSKFPALSLWQDPEYLKKALESVNLTVAQTPTGLADAPGLRNTAFLQPHVSSMNAETFLRHLKNPDKSQPKPDSSSTPVPSSDTKSSSTHKPTKDDDDDIVLYMQSQNNNYPREFPTLANDAPHSIPWADEALNVEGPAAVNLWLGDYRTTSRLHNDNYENLYVQISGSKEIYLIPPGDAYALDERFLKPLSYGSDMSLHDSFAESLQSLQDGDGATYAATQNQTTSASDIDSKQAAANESDFLPKTSANTKPTDNKKPAQKNVADLAAPNILFPTVDPSNPNTFNDIYSNYAFVYRVVLNPGDMLYIPALWYHQVRVVDGAPNVSLNYWYDPPATNGQWMRWDYVRYCSAVLRGYHDPYYFDEKEENQEIEAMLKMEHKQQMKQVQIMEQRQQEYEYRKQKHERKKQKELAEKAELAKTTV